MNIEEFWELIQKARDLSPGDIAQRMELLRVNLEKLPSTEVLDFSNHFQSLLNRAYDWDLWGASWVFMDGCGGDDGFWDFRSALISQGREIFERALEDPDSLADIPEEEVDNMFAEGFQYVSDQVYQERDDGPLDAIHPHAKTPSGTKFDGEDEASLKSRYPRTFARFWSKD